MKKESIFFFFFEVLQTLQIPYRDTPDKRRHVTSCIPTNWLNYVDPFFNDDITEVHVNMSNQVMI